MEIDSNKYEQDSPPSALSSRIKNMDEGVFTIVSGGLR